MTTRLLIENASFINERGEDDEPTGAVEVSGDLYSADSIKKVDHVEVWIVNAPEWLMKEAK